MLHHDFSIAPDAPAVKRRLHQVSLPPPQFSFAGEQPLAEKARVHSRAHAFDKVVVARHQNVLNVIRMRRIADAKPRGAIEENVAVFPRPVFQGRKNVVGEHR